MLSSPCRGLSVSSAPFPEPRHHSAHGFLVEAGRHSLTHTRQVRVSKGACSAPRACWDDDSAHTGNTGREALLLAGDHIPAKVPGSRPPISLLRGAHTACTPHAQRAPPPTRLLHTPLLPSHGAPQSCGTLPQHLNPSAVPGQHFPMVTPAVGSKGRGLDGQVFPMLRAAQVPEGSPHPPPWQETEKASYLLYFNSDYK